MKEKFYTLFLSMACLSILLTSCQKEEQVLIDETPDETITGSSALGRMLVSASQNYGGIDDLIDGSSCISIMFPITVFANSQSLTIQSISDMQTIELIFNQSQTDNDTLEIVFPIVVVFEDYSQDTITSQADLDSLIANCPNFIDDTYSCVEFVYPISCFTYNSANEQTGLVTMHDDFEWFEYLNYLTDDIYIAIDYDMIIIVNGETITVSNNLELEAAFALIDCQTSTTVINPEVAILRDIMKDGSWYISQYLNDGNDETADYVGYYFDFRDSITVYASNGSGVVYGIWIVTYRNGQLNFEFDMDSPINGADDDDYEVLDQTENKITFITRDSSGNIEDTLVFMKN